MKHILPSAVNTPKTAPVYIILRQLAPPNRHCTFLYADDEATQGFLVGLIADGWVPERVDDYLILSAPPTSKITPFPLAHPLLREIEG